MCVKEPLYVDCTLVATIKPGNMTSQTDGWKMWYWIGISWVEDFHRVSLVLGHFRRYRRANARDPGTTNLLEVLMLDWWRPKPLKDGFAWSLWVWLAVQNENDGRIRHMIFGFELLHLNLCKSWINTHIFYIT